MAALAFFLTILACEALILLYWASCWALREIGWHFHKSDGRLTRVWVDTASKWAKGGHHVPGGGT